MRPATIFLLFFFALFSSCEDELFKKDHRFPVQGKWKIREIYIQFSDGTDTLITTDMGYIVFGKCSKADNYVGECPTGLRIYPSGNTGTFHFQTSWDRTPTGEQKRLYMAHKSGDTGKDMFGNYIIRVLTKKELVFYGNNYGLKINRETVYRWYKKFELKATKE